MIFDIVDFTIDATAFRYSKPAETEKKHKKIKPRLRVSIGMVVHHRPEDIPVVINGLLYRFPFGDFIATSVDRASGFITFRSVYYMQILKNFSLAITNGSVEGVLIAMTHSEGN